MFRLNFWSHQPLSGPLGAPPPTPHHQRGVSESGPGSVPSSMHSGLSPFFPGSMIEVQSSRSMHPTQSALFSTSGGLLHGSPVADFNAAASLWRRGFVNGDHVAERAHSPDEKRMSPAEFDNALQSANMTSFPLGPTVGSELRQSLYLRSQLVALRHYQQQQFEAAEMAKLQLAEKLPFLQGAKYSTSPDIPPPPKSTGSTTTTTGSDDFYADDDTERRETSDRKRTSNGSRSRGTATCLTKRRKLATSPHQTRTTTPSDRGHQEQEVNQHDEPVVTRQQHERTQVDDQHRQRHHHQQQQHNRRQHHLSPNDATYLQCPVCAERFRSWDLPSHVMNELDRLQNLLLAENKPSVRISADLQAEHKSVTDAVRRLGYRCRFKNPSSKSRYETFIKVRHNREARIIKLRSHRPRHRHQDSISSASRDSQTKFGALDKDIQPSLNDTMIALRQQTDDDVSDEMHSGSDSEELIDIVGLDAEFESKDQRVKNSDSHDRLQLSNGSSSEYEEAAEDVRVTNGNADEHVSSCSRSNSSSPRDVRSTVTSCAVCSRPPVNPLISTKCWHVHCDVCWTHQLSLTKSCPQCNIPMTEQHLKQIHD